MEIKEIVNENPKSGVSLPFAENKQETRKRPFYGWLIVMSATVVTFTTGPGQPYVFSVFVDPILNDTGLSRTELSFLYSIGTGFSALMAWLISRLVTRFGPRVMLGLIALAFGSACFGIAWAATTFGFLIGFAVLRALGQGSLPLVATLLTVQWFVRHRGRAMALVNLGFPASNALFPLVTQWLIIIAGWRNAYRLLGVAIWFLIIPLTVFVIRDRPEKMGLQPDGLTDTASGRGSDDHSPSSSLPFPLAPRVWRSWSFWKVALALSASPFVVTALIFHQVSIFAERNLEAELAAIIFIVLAIASALMTILTGFILERVEPRLVLLGNLGLLFVSIVSLLFVHDLLSAIAYTVLLGSAMGSQPVIAGVIWAYYYGRENAGAYLGAAAVVLISSPALAPVLLAILHQATGDYILGLLVLLGMTLVCAVFLGGFRSQRP